MLEFSLSMFFFSCLIKRQTFSTRANGIISFTNFLDETFIQFWGTYFLIEYSMFKFFNESTSEKTLNFAEKRRC
jgi:hypothetical protein